MQVSSVITVKVHEFSRFDRRAGPSYFMGLHVASIPERKSTIRNRSRHKQLKEF